MKRLLSLLLALSLLLSATLLLSACGTDDSGASTEDTTDTSEDFEPLAGTAYDGIFYTINIPNGFERFQGSTYLNGTNGLTIDTVQMAATTTNEIPDELWVADLNLTSVLARYNTPTEKNYQIREFSTIKYLHERICEIHYALYNTATKTTSYCTTIAIRSNPDEKGSFQYVNIHMMESDPNRPFAKSLSPTVK
ncbi:MAG: hypothetical protein E7637_01300 [Ruminococcaceae bacterium]|nr:hypothetical protein [Oscillospiraceae bacterium]